MKKIFFILIVIVQLNAGVLESTFDTMANFIFKTAWPTATYEDYEIFEVDNQNNTIIVKMNGYSNLTFMGKGKLYMKIKLYFTENYEIQNVRVISHNAILSPPFNTTKSIAKLISESGNYKE
jgi:hypothetical protein